MCGRYTFSRTEEILRRFQIEKNGIELQPRYNIAPDAVMPVVVRADHNSMLSRHLSAAIAVYLGSLHMPPSKLELADLNADRLGVFLENLEEGRGNGTRTRNLRLTAIRSFFRYAAYQVPEQSALIQRVLAIPNKHYEKRQIGFLIRPEINALLAAPNRNGWVGRRDYAFLLVAVQTGLRLSEMTGLRRQDVVFSTGAHVRCSGKGRKERSTPLTKQAAAVLKAWLREPTKGIGDILFPNCRGGRLSPDGVAYLLSKHVVAAQKTCPSLRGKRVTPHMLRHTAARELLQAGVDRSLIALWLGHESVETTQIYFDAYLPLKEELLAKVASACGVTSGRYRAEDPLLQFLRTL